MASPAIPRTRNAPSPISGADDIPVNAVPGPVDPDVALGGPVVVDELVPLGGVELLLDEGGGVLVDELEVGGGLVGGGEVGGGDVGGGDVGGGLVVGGVGPVPRHDERPRSARCGREGFGSDLDRRGPGDRLTDGDRCPIGGAD